MMRRFRDRQEAGEQMARELEKRRFDAPVVLGLARGGVVVAVPIAKALGAPLDVLVARKVGTPNRPELGIGAVAPGGVSLADERSLRALGMSREQFDGLAVVEQREVDRRLAAYRSGKPPMPVEGRTAIIVDDGLATGVTALAAARYLRARCPTRLVLAVPVVSQEGAERLSSEVDEVVCLSVPEPFLAVGRWYDDFSQVDDDEIVRLLNERR